MEREFGNDRAVAVGDFFREPEIFRRIKLCQSRADHRDRPSARGDGGFVGRGVDPPGEPGNDRETRAGELERELLRGIAAVNRGASRADDSDSMLVALFQLSPNIQQQRWIIGFAQWSRIVGVVLGDDGNASFSGVGQLLDWIGVVLPAVEDAGGFLADAVDSHQLVLRGPEDRLRLAEEFQQAPNPDWADLGQEVEGDERFSGSHKGEKIRNSKSEILNCGRA